MDWYNKSAEEALREQNSDAERGLTAANAAHRLERYGKNELPEQGKKTIWQRIWEQVADFMILILVAAALISFAMNEPIEGAVILAIVVLNAALGIVQEGSAEKALEALKKMAAPHARVLRDGGVETVPTADLAPGDIVLLEAGDIVSADMRLVESASLRIDESSLTGESVPVEKDASATLDGETGLGDRVNMGYMGTIVTYGRGRGVVVGTGLDTQIGHIANKLSGIEDEQTPLQRNLAQLGKVLGIACLAVCALVFLLFMLRHGFAQESIFEAFMVSVSLAVAAIPEGLPAIVTIVLAMGMKRMVARNAIMRRLLAVETLGCVNVICSDKTGTLTQNEMTAVTVWSGGRAAGVTGRGYAPTGLLQDADGNNLDLTAHRDLMMTLTAAALCNDAMLKERADGAWGITGDPTEGALVTLAAKAGLEKSALEKAFPRIGELPFDSDRKMMTTFHRGGRGRAVSYTKGAPDVVLERCTHINRGGRVVPLDARLKAQAENVNRLLARQALRVLAVAYREYDSAPPDASPDTIERNMTLAGLVGMIDPARPEARDAIAVCRRAGIRPVMITGDYRDTAVAIAEDLDLKRDGDGVLTGAELEGMTDTELQEAVLTTAVYARVSPEHKVRIVTALRENGDIAAMTGDGVNDAMALKRADIGVSMGITGTDVAKSTADMVLTDDNFASIVSAVEEGRIIYANIRKFVFFLLSCNIGEILIVFFALLLNMPVPLTAIQLLWLNLVTDSFPALALGNEPGERDIMRRAPRRRDESILDGSMMIAIGVQSVVLAVTVLGAYALALGNAAARGFGDAPQAYAGTVAFAILISAELFRAFSCRSERTPLLRLGLGTNKKMLWAALAAFGLMLVSVYLLQPIFGTVSLGIFEWAWILLGCLLPLLAGELYKLALPALERRFPKLFHGKTIAPDERDRPAHCKPRRSLFERIAGADPTLMDEDDEDDTIIPSLTLPPDAPDADDIPDMPEEGELDDALTDIISEVHSMPDTPENDADIPADNGADNGADGE